VRPAAHAQGKAATDLPVNMRRASGGGRMHLWSAWLICSRWDVHVR
jgi:hypothetical protein